MLISHILCSKKMAPKASRNTGGAGGSGGKTLPSDLIKKFKSVMSYRGGTPEMKALHDEYRLGSFEKKMEILSNFQKDSKCSWVTSFLSQEKEVEKEEETVVSSWKTRRQIAAHYCLNEDDPAQKKELEAILEDMECELLEIVLFFIFF